VVAVTLLLLMGIGFVIGLVANGRWYRDDRPAQPDRPPPFALIGLVGMVAVVGSVATTLAYRRISRPVGDLLGAAERVAEGDYDVEVRPDGPRELRVLTSTFNDMAARLATTEEQRRRFLADVTHELRTPLAVLQSGIEAQLDGIHPRDDAHLASLLEETQRLGHLVDDLHTLALADAGRLALHRERRQPSTLVQDAVDDHAPLAARKQVRIRPSFADELPDVDVDPTRFRQILDNLLSNAVRHTDPGGEVRVLVDTAAARLRVTVIDAGPGFPADRLEQLFDRSARPADAGSSGLGLSIVHDLVRAHGGTVQATNPPGGGASVSFSVPAVVRGR
jgi:two-component system, OmpR family, sensor histidine kinase BaeS